MEIKKKLHWFLFPANMYPPFPNLINSLAKESSNPEQRWDKLKVSEMMFSFHSQRLCSKVSVSHSGKPGMCEQVTEGEAYVLSFPYHPPTHPFCLSLLEKVKNEKCGWLSRMCMLSMLVLWHRHIIVYTASIPENNETIGPKYLFIPQLNKPSILGFTNQRLK